MGVISVLLGQIERCGGVFPTFISESKVVFQPGSFPHLLPLFLKLYVCPNAFSDFDRLIMCLVKQ